MRNLMIHVDVDSPLKLIDFYNIKGVKYSQKQLDEFYLTSFNRAFDFFEKLGVTATFFVVGDELDKSEVIQRVILNAFEKGHEIENHTYSHPFGLTKLSDSQVRNEIIKCNDIITSIIKVAPVGFRSPGYNMNTTLINVLEELNFKYDSSGFWSILNPVLSVTHKLFFKNGLNNADFGGVNRNLKQIPYYPHKHNWMKLNDGKRKLMELPLPRTNFLSLPFYNNINLWAPFIYSNYISKKIKKNNIIYLFHIIEFMDIKDDNIPSELIVHPNVKCPVEKKLNKSQIIISNLLKRYHFVTTRNFLKSLNDN